MSLLLLFRFLTPQTNQRTVSDSLTTDDSVVRRKDAYRSIPEDGQVASDSVVRGYVGARSVQDTLHTTDSVAISYGGSNFLASAQLRPLVWSVIRKRVLSAAVSGSVQWRTMTRYLSWNMEPRRLVIPVFNRKLAWAGRSRGLNWTLGSWINMSTLSTQPDTFELTINETLIITVDMTNYIPSGQTIVNSPAPTATVVEQATSQTVAGVVTSLSRVDVSPGTANGLQFTLNGPTLRVNHRYTLRLGFQTNTGNILNTLTTLSTIAQ